MSNHYHVIHCRGLLTACLLLLSCFNLPAQPGRWRRTRLPASLKEVSGLTLGPDNSLWALNDSGNPPELFELDAQTLKTRRKLTLPVPNRDWEDLTSDPAGQLYIGDFGNNGNRRRDLRIYRYHPQHGTIDSILFQYPDQRAFPPEDPGRRQFDCEAMVFWQDSLHLFTKSLFKGDFYSKHYVLPAQPGQYTASLRDSVYLRRRVVSGAAISADGRTLALTAYYIGFFLKCFPYTKAHLYFFQSETAGHFLQGKRNRRRLPKFLIARQFESVMWREKGVWLLANEGIGPQKAACWRLRE